MHLRYDLKNKLDLSNFEKQALFFLNKEDCTFSFYLNEFAILFDVYLNKKEGSSEFNVEASISELNKDENSTTTYRTVDPNQDPRFNGISLVTEIFVGTKGIKPIKTKQEVLEFIYLMIKIINKVNKLSFIA